MNARGPSAICTYIVIYIYILYTCGFPLKYALRPVLSFPNSITYLIAQWTWCCASWIWMAAPGISCVFACVTCLDVSFASCVSSCPFCGNFYHEGTEMDWALHSRTLRQTEHRGCLHLIQVLCGWIRRSLQEPFRRDWSFGREENMK